MSFDRDLIFAYCQPIYNLFCGAVYCVVGQVTTPSEDSIDWAYTNKEILLTDVAPYLEKLEQERDINIYTKILTPEQINYAGMQVEDYIKHNLNLLVRRFAYTYRIKNPKVHLCGPSLPFEAGTIEYVQGDYLEANVIRAVSYIKRYSLIDTHYIPVYRDCKLGVNHGIMTLDSLKTIVNTSYKENFFLHPSILTGLPILMLDALRYIPGHWSRKEIEERGVRKVTERLFNKDVGALPVWWTTVQYPDYPDPTKQKAYKKLRDQLMFGKNSPEFTSWLHKMSSRTKDQYNSIILNAELQPHRTSSFPREAL